MKKETKSKAISDAKLNHIGKGVDDINEKITKGDKKIEEMNNKLIRVDESTKSAHKRIDNIVKKGS